MMTPGQAGNCYPIATVWRADDKIVRATLASSEYVSAFMKSAEAKWAGLKDTNEQAKACSTRKNWEGFYVDRRLSKEERF
jgi:hypothetical protein